jgi:predicted acylesterase/phospholipase RssA
MDVQRLQDWCRDNIGDITFKEAYEKTRRNVNIVVTHTSYNVPALLNHLTSPNVLLWSAACASCAQPGLYAPVGLMAKDFNGHIVDFAPISTHVRMPACVYGYFFI